MKHRRPWPSLISRIPHRICRLHCPSTQTTLGAGAGSSLPRVAGFSIGTAASSSRTCSILRCSAYYLEWPPGLQLPQERQQKDGMKDNALGMIKAGLLAHRCRRPGALAETMALTGRDPLAAYFSVTAMSASRQTSASYALQANTLMT
jgi:hypothetical protein